MTDKLPISDLFKNWLQRRRTPQPPLQIRPESPWEFAFLDDTEDLSRLNDIQPEFVKKASIVRGSWVFIPHGIILGSGPMAASTIAFPMPIAAVAALSPKGAPLYAISYRPKEYKKKPKKNIKNTTPSVECVFCKNNGENPEVYKTHIVKDPQTKIVTCPKLRALDPCRKCGGFGDNAHTKMHCPRNQPDFPLAYGKSANSFK